jgi:hypothetical protein
VCARDADMMRIDLFLFPTRQFSLAKIYDLIFLIETSMYINVISSRESFVFI